MSQTVGIKIREARKTKGLTQKELGEKAGIAEPTIRRYELGKLNPKRETVEKIAAALGVSWLDLIPKEALNANTVEAFAAKSTENATLVRETMQHLPDETARIVQQLADAAKGDTYPEIQAVSDIMQTMNDTGRRVAVERVQELAQIPAYQKQPDPDKK